MRLFENLEFQLNDFISIKVMSHLAVGEQHEKLGGFNAAIRFYSEGKSFAEKNFGPKHPLYTKCINAMGGARLKSKYQTKDVYRTKGSEQAKEPSPPKTGNPVSLPRVKPKEQKYPDTLPRQSQGKAVARRMHNSTKKVRRDIKGLVMAAEVRQSNKLRRSRDNLLLANCDSFSSVHCLHPRTKRRESLLSSIQKKTRPSSSRHERHKSRERALSKDFLETMSDKRAPYKVVCKVGPKCQNHDWSVRSPLKKVCTRGVTCPNHDWEQSGLTRSSRSLRKMQIDSSINFDRASQQSMSNTQVEEKVTERIESVEVDSKSNHSFMMQQSERMHYQQMQQLRTLHEDQFKMLQLVLEKTSQANQATLQQQPALQYMYYPNMFLQQQQQQQYM